nr:uncharacterized protein LOC9266421 isoform X2 [Oryza sativa Japonica Group]
MPIQSLDKATAKEHLLLPPEFPQTPSFFRSPTVAWAPGGLLHSIGGHRLLNQKASGCTAWRDTRRRSAVGDPQSPELKVEAANTAVRAADVEPCISGPKSPHDRVPLKEMKSDWHACLDSNFKCCSCSNMQLHKHIKSQRYNWCWPSRKESL